jgi:cell division protein FtsW
LRRKEKKIDIHLFLIVSALILIGSIMVYSSSSAIADGSEKFSSHAFFLKRQLIWLVMAFLTIFIAVHINLDNIRGLIGPTLLVCMFLLMIVFLTPKIRDTHRWLALGFITLQPSELFKYVLVFYLAHSLSQKNRSLDTLELYRWPYAPIICLSSILIVLEPDLGSVLVLGATVILIFYLAGARLLHLAVAFGGSGLAIYLLVFVAGYRKGRIETYLASLADPMMAAHQVKQSMLVMLSLNSSFCLSLTQILFLPQLVKSGVFWA